MRQDKRPIEAVGGETVVSEAGANAFAKLRELTRSGYVPEPSEDDDEDGIRFRHPSAPDLVLRADGKIDLPLGQRPRRAAPEPPLRRLDWPRTGLIVVGAAGLWLLAVFLTVLFIES